MLLDEYRALPLRVLGSRSLQTYSQHRCDPYAVGHSRIDDPAYRYDNRERVNMCLLQVTVAGEGRFVDHRRGVETALTPGDAFLVPFPSETSYHLPEGGDWEFFFVTFSGDQAAYHCRTLVERYGALWQLPPESEPMVQLVQLFRELLDVDASGDLLEYRGSTLLYAILMALYGHRQRLAAAADMPEDVRRAQAYMERHLHEPGLDLDTIAAAAGYSKYHFGRRYKAHVGTSPYAWLLQARLRRALRLVVETQQPMKQVAQSVGIPDYPYFCNVFKAHVGHTPATARRQGSRFAGELAGPSPAPATDTAPPLTGPGDPGHRPPHPQDFDPCRA